MVRSGFFVFGKRSDPYLKKVGAVFQKEQLCIFKGRIRIRSDYPDAKSLQNQAGIELFFLYAISGDIISIIMTLILKEKVKNEFIRTDLGCFSSAGSGSGFFLGSDPSQLHPDPQPCS